MAEHAASSTLETTVNNLTNECEDGQDNQAPDVYTPVFQQAGEDRGLRAWLGRFLRRPWFHDLW